MSSPRHRFSRVLLLTFTVAGTVLFACSGSEETSVVIDDDDGPTPTPIEAETALNEALQAFNEYCLAAETQGSETSYPTTLVTPNRGGSSYEYRQFEALMEAGLLDTTVVQTRGNVPAHRFSLTEKGRRNQFEIADSRGYKRMFCYAIPQVAQLDSIKAVFNAGPNPLVRVWFTYEHSDLRRWVESPRIQSTFSGVPSLSSFQQPQTAKELLIQVDSAWVDRRLTGYDRPPERPNAPS